jgi:3'(2'), 5'-bisphosphate nucleotidase
MSDAARFLETACALAQRASNSILTFHGNDLKSERKADKTLVTEADLAADQIIREGLEQAFPDHGILTEEFGLIAKENSPWLWLIDPLDGTKAFVKNIPGFSVMIGLLYQGQPHLGVVMDPVTQRLYAAVKDQGACLYHDGTKEELKVSKRSAWNQMPLILSTGFPEDKLKQIKQRLDSPVCEPINSVGIKVGLLVCQVGDIYLSHHPVHYWDSCAPQIILEEAGGIFTKIDGTPLDYDLAKGTAHDNLPLATNGSRHQELVELIKQTF